MPYYWNIAPNRDATFTPRGRARGAGRRSRPSSATSSRAYAGELDAATCCPTTALDGRSRYALSVRRTTATCRAATRCAAARAARLRRRLLEGLPGASRRRRRRACCRPTCWLTRPFGDWIDLCARVQLAGAADRRPDDPDRLAATSARRRSARATPAALRAGFDVGFEAEFNRFADPDDRFLGAAPDRRARCTRSAASARPFVSPRLDAHARSSRSTPRRYSLDHAARRTAGTAPSRVIPTFSVDSAWTLERDATLVRPRGAPDARAAPALRQHAVPATRRACRTSTRRRRTSTSIRSSPRTRSRASTASPMRTS